MIPFPEYLIMVRDTINPTRLAHGLPALDNADAQRAYDLALEDERAEALELSQLEPA